MAQTVIVPGQVAIVSQPAVESLVCIPSFYTTVFTGPIYDTLHRLPAH